MKQPFRTIFSLLLLVVFIAGSSGISFIIHECTSSRTTEVFPFPEILNNTVFCCCDEEIQQQFACENPVSSFTAPECCKNTHVYLKASFTGFPVFYKFHPELVQKIISADLLDFSYSNQHIEIPVVYHRVDHPPPRSGKLLVCFIQQLKIPFPVS